MSGLYTTGTVKTGAAAAGAISRAFMRGWNRSREERREREELLAQLAADMRLAVEQQRFTDRV